MTAPSPPSITTPLLVAAVLVRAEAGERVTPMSHSALLVSMMGALMSDAERRGREAVSDEARQAWQICREGYQRIFTEHTLISAESSELRTVLTATMIARGELR